MEIKHDEHGRIVIVGEFFMVQRTDLALNQFAKPPLPKFDTHGNPRLAWPGGSAFTTFEQANEVKNILSSANPEFTFVVMRSM